LFNENLLEAKVQNFIRTFDGSLSRLAFSGSPFLDISAKELIQQIEGRNKMQRKLPTWFSTQNILYPPKINLEQTSSEITAIYKASLVRGDTLADITGGFGVDSYFFSEKFTTVHHFELDGTLSKIAQHNFSCLNRSNIQCFSENGLDKVLNHHYGTIYADPSRRHESKGKVFFLKDCLPNIPENQVGILAHCDTFLLKTSPMLDLSVGLKELGEVSEIHIVAVDNEVKELLWLINKGQLTPTKILAVNFTKNGKETFDFDYNDCAAASYGAVQKYLYEPNAAILKSGAFDLISKQFGLDKLHKNTHLYTGNILVDFPGRRFVVDQVVPYNKTEMRKALTFKKANVTTRNFPESVENLRKKWKLMDGGDIYLFFVTNMEGKKEMILCSKV